MICSGVIIIAYVGSRYANSFHMKNVFAFFLLLIIDQQAGISQTRYQERLDSLHMELKKATQDTSRQNLMIALLSIYDYHKPAEGLSFKDSALAIARYANTKAGTARIKDKIGRIYWRLGKFDEALKFHFEALAGYEELGDKYARNAVLVSIGQDYLNATNFDEAYKYLSRSIKLSEETGDKKNLAYTYNILTALHENQGNYTEASKAIFANLKIYEEIGDKKGIAYALLSVASHYNSIGNTSEALKCHHQSLKLGIEVGDPLVQTYAYGSMGDIYLAMKNFSEAELQFQKGLKVAEGMENAWITTPILYRGLGNVYRAKGNYNEALHYLLITANEFRAIASNHALASLYSEIGTVYIKLRKYDKARKYFDSSIALCKTLDTKIPLADYYNGIQLLDSATGNWKNAYNNYKEYASIKDSAFNKETLRKLLMSQVQYDNEKKEAVDKAEREIRDAQIKEEATRQRNIRNTTFAVLGVVLIFSVVVYRQRNKIAGEKKRSDLLLNDKELLLREIHHRVKNNLEVVGSLLALQSAQIDDPNVQAAMLEGQNRVHSIGIVHQKLYHGENLGAIEMKDYFVNLSESILDSFGAEGRVNVELAMDKLNIDIDTAVPLGLIVNELLTNTLKYAFPDNRQGLIRIKLEKQENGNLDLEVSDNGIGKSGITHGTGFGSQLISLLTRQLNGSMREENTDGTRVFFHFRLENAA
jgi:two-component sensor histidine kinase